MKLPEKVKVFTDGASRGNPGPAALGVAFYDENDTPLTEFKESLGMQTNNYAEYMAVIKALEISLDQGVKFLHIYCDSELLVKQMSGEYKVKSPHIRELFIKAKKFTEKLSHVSFHHVKREFNKKADALANQALDGF